MINKKPRYEELVQQISRLETELTKTQWLHEKTHALETAPYSPFYGDVTELNTERTILDTVGKEMLKTITSDLMDLLDTSIAVYEKNGDYAYGLFNSGWCQLLDASSRKLCNTDDNITALKCGKWLCHDDCWNNSAKAAIISKKPTDIQCIGAIRLYAEPIFVGHEVIGVINIGHGNPPTDETTLKQLSKKYNIDYETLHQKAAAYKPRPDFIIEIAKKRLKSSAKLIGEIVSRKLAEQALTEKEEKYRQLFHFMPMGITLSDENGNIIDCNKFAEKILGLSKDEQKKRAIDGNEWVIVRTDGSLMPAEEFASVRALKEKRLIENVEMGIKNSQGETTWITVSAIPQHKGSGVIISYADITQQKKNKEKLMQQHNYLEKLNNSLADVVFTVRISDRKIKYVNHSIKKVFGYTPDECINKNTNFLYPDKKGYETFGAKLETALRNNKSFFETEHIFQRKNGEVFPAEITISFLKENEEIVEVIAIVSDISERKKVEDTLKQNATDLKSLNSTLEKANTTQNKFFKIIAHDLRNSFNLTLGFSKILIEKTENYDKQKIKQFLRTIYDTSQKAYNLLEDLLKWSLMQSKDFTFNPEKIHLPNIIYHTVQQVTELANTKNISIDCSTLSQQTVYADSNMLCTILRNLLSNSIKFTENNGKITLNATQKGNETLIKVNDTGIGMDTDTLNRLFKIEEKTSTKGTNNETGSGLGLVLCKEFVEKHGGKIWAESQINKGTTISFTIKNR